MERSNNGQGRFKLTKCVFELIFLIKFLHQDIPKATSIRNYFYNLHLNCVDENSNTL